MVAQNLPNAPTIPAPSLDPRGEKERVRLVIEGYEMLTGQRGTGDRVVLFSDLFELGILVGQSLAAATAASSGLGDAPHDGQVYGRKDGAWVVIPATP